MKPSVDIRNKGTERANSTAGFVDQQVVRETQREETNSPAAKRPKSSFEQKA